MLFEAENGVLIYYLPKELDHYTADMMKRKSEHIFEQEQILYLIFDFEKTEFMDSSGIGFITGRFRKVHDIGGAAFAVGICESIDRILKLSGIYQIVKKMDSIDSVKTELLKGGYYE